MKNSTPHLFTIFLLLLITGCKKDGEKLPDAPNPPRITVSNDIVITSLGGEFYGSRPGRFSRTEVFYPAL
ncbi:hypothetical protein [Paraflavitalea speifideaquila]|uniref:hypothetical protein n=1 Tax=Paraflavitalea speifideaquila TaxID=3076558 RepID=UPI0028E7E39F|nr:hypothetical protein [Paraflavitalea speifideiaquila]